MKKRRAIIYYAGFLSRSGGAFFHAINLKTEMEKTAWSVNIITLDNLPFWCRFLPHISEKIVNFFKVPMGFVVKGNLIKFFYYRFFNLDAELRIFEDIHISWNSTTPSLTMLHAVWSDNIQAFKYSKPNYQRLLAAEIDLINTIDHKVITVSLPYREYLLEKHFSKQILKDIEVVPLGIDQAVFNKSYAQQRNSKSIIYCGTLEARKNLDFLFSVFEKIVEQDKDFKLTLVGDGPQRLSLMQRSQDKELKVIFKGRLSHTEVVAELHEHDIYVHTSLKESFSYALLEAKLAGLKTCASSLLEVPPEFIDLGFDSYSVDEWSRSILAMDISPSNFDSENFTSAKMAHSTLDLCG